MAVAASLSPLATFALLLAHVLATVLWIGIVFFYNYVSFPALGRALEASALPAALARLANRALIASALGVTAAVLTGSVMYYDRYASSGDWIDSFPARTIAIGAVLGVTMLVNTWLLLWPSQRRVIDGLVRGDRDEAAGRLLRTSGRVNAVLAFPTIALMVAAGYYPLGWVGIAELTLGASLLAIGGIALTGRVRA